MNKMKGFTLVEVLLVIVIIVILAGLVIVAINPGRQISQANNTQRTTDVKAILDALNSYGAENRGALPAAVTDIPQIIGSGTGQVDICADLVDKYLAAMPFDPIAAGAGYTDCADYNTGYTVSKDATSNRVTVSAGSAELGATITVTR